MTILFQILLENGADKDITNNDGKIPGQVATDPNLKNILGVSNENGSCENGNVISGSKFVPNYLQYPASNYKVDISQKPKVEDRKAIETENKDENGTEEFVILKVRVAHADPDFIEIDVPKSELNLESLKSILCSEMEISNPDSVERIRKLPNTRLRRDVEVARLKDYSELELVVKWN